MKKNTIDYRCKNTFLDENTISIRLFLVHATSTNPSLESAQSMEYCVSKVPGFPPDSAVSTPWLWTQFNPTLRFD